MIECVKIIIFALQSKQNSLKRGAGIVSAAAVDLTLGWFLAVSAQCAVEFQKKNFISMFLGTCLVNDYKTIFFSHAHSGLQSDGKQKTVKSGEIRSKATLCRYSPMVDANFFSLPPGTSGQVGLLKLPIK